MENETPEQMLKREISTLMQRFGITSDRVYAIVSELEAEDVDNTYVNDRPWLQDF